MRLARLICLIAMASMAIAIFLIQPVHAVNPDEILADQALEQRARNLSASIRCMKCQNQSIDDSDASLARDLRILVRERLVAGDSDQQVLDYLVSRYGEFVLLKPRFSISNLLLWLSPVLGLLLAIILVWRVFKSREQTQTHQSAPPLTRKEQDKLSKILSEE